MTHSLALIMIWSALRSGHSALFFFFFFFAFFYCMLRETRRKFLNEFATSITCVFMFRFWVPPTRRDSTSLCLSEITTEQIKNENEKKKKRKNARNITSWHAKILTVFCYVSKTTRIIATNISGAGVVATQRYPMEVQEQPLHSANYSLSVSTFILSCKAIKNR